VALVKPQFEVGRGQVGKGGIVRDPALHLEALLGVLSPLREPEPEARVETARLAAWRILESPIRGAEGNREFFVYLVPGYDRPWTEVEDEARRVAGGPASPP
jgi:23S rRNA (cytidine1920-2'-O)/16S rRNA (cytidine1409-2'-O)-methyltransferase